MRPNPKMAASAKTLMEFLQPPAAKRIKRASSVSPPPVAWPALSQDATTPSISPDQKLRMDFNKALARSKRNLKLCSDKVSKSTDAGMGYVKLEELLVEETWLEVLPGELQKPYAKKLCAFVENEICGGSMPVYPPQNLIFNALNTTPFDQVKAVIIGQDPYHGPGQAMGLSFSVPNGVKVPSSLANIYKEIQQDLGCSMPSKGNLEKWAVQVRFTSPSVGINCSPAWIQAPPLLFSCDYLHLICFTKELELHLVLFLLSMKLITQIKDFGGKYCISSLLFMKYIAAGGVDLNK